MVQLFLKVDVTATKLKPENEELTVLSFIKNRKIHSLNFSPLFPLPRVGRGRENTPVGVVSSQHHALPPIKLKAH